MKIKAPNGLVFDLPDSVATGLLSSKGSGFVKYEPAPEPQADKPELKPRRGRKPKTEAAS